MAKNRRILKKRRTAKKRQNGGVAPVGYTIPPNQRQPTEAIMERATTAGGGIPNYNKQLKEYRESTTIEERFNKFEDYEYPAYKQDINNRFSEINKNIEELRKELIRETKPLWNKLQNQTPEGGGANKYKRNHHKRTRRNKRN